MIALTGKYKVLKVNEGTKAAFFKDLIPGDTLEFVYAVVKTTGASQGGLYATNLEVNCTRLGVSVHTTVNVLMNRLEGFELQEIK
ncbi:MAG: hypothetical protein GWN00_01465 [Aliifodinibius sp.]|nr:hypothetical protein [Phycisphaerae bacterium]NIR62347.1 hypothetical protein [candidate division Zixibacteria bacterium]NIT54947.1 hypothetical protein [Fodinibius sp.]NIW43359.1 hypothetical protein [Gammaproteobacteria bacterium]NIU12581.1 hypothetical protein [candidate division Zixibacteria bacterium]